MPKTNEELKEKYKPNPKFVRKMLEDGTVMVLFDYEAKEPMGHGGVEHYVEVFS